MGMNVGAGKKGPSAEINITPLIDVVLVLLIIFMVLVPSTLKRLTATLPRRDPSTSQGDSDQIVLKIGPQGQLSLNDQPVEPAALRQRIAQRLASDPHKVVFFDIDDDARYGAVVRFLDLARGAGARALAIVARDGKP
jgi:biopolymer transport protein TolR